MPPHTFFLFFFCRRDTWFVSFHGNLFQIRGEEATSPPSSEEASLRLLRVWSVYRVLLCLISPMSPVISLGLQTPGKKERKSTTNKQTNVSLLSSSMLQCVAVCCSVLQCVDVYCSVSLLSSGKLQCVAVCCSVSLLSSSMLQCVAVCCSVS